MPSQWLPSPCGIHPKPTPHAHLVAEFCPVLRPRLKRNTYGRQRVLLQPLVCAALVRRHHFWVWCSDCGNYSHGEDAKHSQKMSGSVPTVPLGLGCTLQEPKDVQDTVPDLKKLGFYDDNSDTSIYMLS
ncbi:LYR motif-containing protein 2 isoform X1 [Octodon degus]|uniref:LYR motif-containing protein 2 isoform X1 n=1 Tax=Octodon degus TaxID=10160 RepID=A0A6P6E5R2_OCTDE|nr:LYR motif-containing protein 2 isoform X1 [Octodon degus]